MRYKRCFPACFSDGFSKISRIIEFILPVHWPMTSAPPVAVVAVFAVADIFVAAIVVTNSAAVVVAAAMHQLSAIVVAQLASPGPMWRRPARSSRAGRAGIGWHWRRRSK